MLGIGDWGLGIDPNPQSPLPNPHNIKIIYHRILLFVYSLKYKYVSKSIKFIIIFQNKYIK